MIIVQTSNSVTHTTHHMSRAHSAFDMTEDGQGSTGSHEASEGYPREGLHWLIMVDCSIWWIPLGNACCWNQETSHCWYVYIYFDSMDDSPKSSPAIKMERKTHFSAARCILFEKGEWPKSLVFVQFSCFVFCIFWRCSPTTACTSTISCPMVRWCSPGGQHVLDVPDEVSSQPSPAGEVIDAGMRLKWLCCLSWEESFAFFVMLFSFQFILYFIYFPPISTISS